MKVKPLPGVLAFVVAVLGLAMLRPGAAGVHGRPAPPFPSARPADWIGPPQSWQSLRGRVVLLDVWTFG